MNKKLGRQKCPECGEFIQVAGIYKSLAFPGAEPYCRLECKCGWVDEYTYTVYNVNF